MIQKIRITTEEEAKAALAERRRLAREQAEREAELERQRQVCTRTISNNTDAHRNFNNESKLFVVKLIAKK